MRSPLQKFLGMGLLKQWQWSPAQALLQCRQALVLSPARRGRGILVAPGFCPASSVLRPASRFLMGAKTTSKFSLKFQHDIPSNMEMCKWFFRDATEILNGRKRSTLKFFVGVKFKVGNYSNFTITFRMIWRCAGDFSKVLLKFKMAATDQL